MGDLDLYALPPERFTAARDAAVKQVRAGGDKAGAMALAALRRPSVPAHLVNLLVRAEPALVEQLLEIGAQLGRAQRDGRGEALRAVGDQRRALVTAVTGRAVALGDREVPVSVRAEVEATLEAALSDPAAGSAVRSGRLVRALTFAGFGGADLDGAVAPDLAPERSPDPAPTAPDSAAEAQAHAEAERRARRRATEVRAAERAAHDAAGRLDDAVRAYEQTHRRQERAARASDTAQAAVREAEQALAGAQEGLAAAVRAQDGIDEQAGRAQEVVRDAQQQAEDARAALDRLRRA